MLDIARMDTQPGAQCGKRGRARVQLDSFGLPSRCVREVHEPTGMRTDVEQPPSSTASRLETAEDRLENHVLVAAVEFLLDPVMRPELVVQTIKELRQDWEALGLRKSTRSAAAKPDRLSRIGGKIWMLIAIQLEVEDRIVLTSEHFRAADPACCNCLEPGMHHDSVMSAMSRAMSSQVRARSTAAA